MCGSMAIAAFGVVSFWGFSWNQASSAVQQLQGRAILLMDATSDQHVPAVGLDWPMSFDEILRAFAPEALKVEI